MELKIKHYGLITGLLSVIVSFLFFIIQRDFYVLLLFGGFLVTAVCYLMILFGKESGKTKLLWTLLVVLGIFIQSQTEGFFITSSYRLYFKNNYSTLMKVNNLLKDKNGEIVISKNRISADSNNLTLEEKDELSKLREELDVYRIYSSDSVISYGLYGMLDVRLGIVYWTGKEKPNENFRHLKGNWWYH